MKHVFAVLGCSLSLLSPQAAGAQARPGKAPAPAEASPAADPRETADYKRVVDEALKEYGLGHFEEARSLFERAHTLYPNARTLRGLGMVEFELRHYVSAEQQLQASLASDQKPLTDEQRKAVEELLARTRQFIAQYALEVEPPRDGLTVELDGRRVPLQPDQRLSVEAGEHTLRISAPGAEPRELHIDVKGGERQTLRVELVVAGPRQVPQTAPVAPPPAQPIERRRPYSRAGIGLMAGGGAALIAGGVMGALALTKANDVETSEGGEADAARGLALGSDIAIGVGAAAAVVGIVLFTRRERPKSAGARIESAFPHLKVKF